MDPVTGKEYAFLTNNWKLAVTTIADIDKSRWQSELFFKWIKQNLKIKSFLGTSPKAVLTQCVGGHGLLFVAHLYKISDKIGLFPDGTGANDWRSLDGT